MPPYRRSVELLNYMNEVFSTLKMGDRLDALINASNASANAALNSAAIAIATTPTQVRTGAALSYQVNGTLYTKAATDNFWTLTGPVLADGQSRKYLLCIDAAGAASVVRSETDLPTAQASKLTFPTVPAGRCVVGVVQVDTAGAVFTPGTTSLAAATATDTYTNGAPAGVVYAGPVAPLV
jgi:hypothetical protein